MLNRQLQTFYQVCLNCADIKDVKFAYALIKNRDAIAKEITKLSKLESKLYKGLKISKDFKEFDTLRQELCEKYSKKDKKGRVMFIQSQDGSEKYDIDDMKKFTREVKSLQKQFKDAIKKRQDDLNGVDRMIWDAESKLKIHKIEYLPENVSARQRDGLTGFMWDEK
jgi:hypothetical protein